MIEATKTIKIDLLRRSKCRLVFATQNDVGMRRVRAIITNDGKPVAIGADIVAYASFLRPDGDSASVLCEISEDGSAVFTIPLWALALAGEVKCSVSLFGPDDSKITSAQFSLDVESALYSGDDVIEDEDYPLIVSLMSTMAGYSEDEAQRKTAEAARVEAENKRQELDAARTETVSFFENKGAIIVSKEEPDVNMAHVWIDPAFDEEEISLLDSTNITQELSDDIDKVPSVALLKHIAEDNTVGDNVLTDEDIVQELSDDTNKVPSVALLKQCMEQNGENSDLGGVDEALDRIIGIQETLIGVIEFSILDTEQVSHTYKAIKDMSWVEWCNSEYNMDGFYVNKNVYTADGAYIVTDVAPNDVINSGEIYYTSVVIKEITFTIDGTTYTAEDGMTWAEWCDSKYNTDGFEYYEDCVYWLHDETGSHFNICVYGTETYLGSSELIIANGTYWTR